MTIYRIGNIVRHTPTGELFEITEVRGETAIGRPIDGPSRKQYGFVVLLLADTELLLDDATDTFNTLFEGDE